MPSYDLFEMRTQQGVHTKRVNTLRPTQYSREVNLTVDIAQHVFEALQWEMASMHIKFNELKMDRNFLCDQSVET
jgi:hypothetical protein